MLGYFQVDATGRTTTPTINDEVPQLSEPDRLADNRAFRDRVSRDLSARVAPTPAVKVPLAPAQQKVGSKSVQIDQSVYAQNANPGAVYSQKLLARPKADVPVTITISPLEWRTLPFSGAPALVAVREVETPDGTLTQGFVVDRSVLTKRLASKAGGMVSELHADATRGVPVAPGWTLSVAPDPRTLAQADADAIAVARGFLMRFVGIGSIAVLAAVSVLMLVTRSEKLARERSQFAAAAAHELRTPLTGLQLYGDMLADGLGDPAKARDYARRMSEEASRLGRVVSNVLGFSQLESGSLTVDAKSGLLGEALRELAERARPALDLAGAVLELDVPADLQARFDSDALARIVGNLLDNAEKYAREADDRTIRLTARDRGDLVEVSVEDRGPGIADQTKLFHAFSRGVTGTANPAGLGLGLALSMSLARAMGGDRPTGHVRAAAPCLFCNCQALDAYPPPKQFSIR